MLSSRPPHSFVTLSRRTIGGPAACRPVSILPTQPATSTAGDISGLSETKRWMPPFTGSNPPITKTDPPELMPFPMEMPIGAAHGRPFGTLGTPEATGPFARIAGSRDIASPHRFRLGGTAGACAAACLGFGPQAGAAAGTGGIDLPAARAEAAHQQRRLGRANPFADLFPGSRAIVAVTRCGGEAPA